MSTPKPSRASKKTATKNGQAQPTDPFATAKKVNITGDYYFEPHEKQALGMTLAGLYTKREEITAHKKDLMAQINAQAAGVDAEIKGSANKIRSGFEPREMEVFVLFNNPTKNQKSFYRSDTRALVRSEIMLPSDYEQELPMPGLPPKAEKPEKPAKKSPAAKVPPGGDDKAGMTSLGDALDAAAVGLKLDPFPFDIHPMDMPKEIARKFAKAAIKAGWPLPAVAILRDEVKKSESHDSAAETLAPYITSSEAK